jgi:hypothetical protein
VLERIGGVTNKLVGFPTSQVVILYLQIGAALIYKAKQKRDYAHQRTRRFMFLQGQPKGGSKDGS